jgi:hypothetical protein|nr:MAG TPA: hypothetical protein [Caudoviricetes sp.]
MKEYGLSKKINSYVNEEKKVVTTTIKATIEDDFSLFPNFAKFVGKAKCSQEDDFDVELGKKISKNRAWLKYDNAILKGIRMEIKDTEEYLKALKKDEQKYINLIQKTTDKIEELCDSTEE